MHLFCQESGSGSTLVLVHGFPFDSTMWDPQRAALGEHCRLLTPDLRGYGRSTATAESTYTIDALADDVIETLDSMGVDQPFVLGGLSMGGYVALSIAARYANRLRGLLLIDTRAGADTPEAATGRRELAAKVDATGDLDLVVPSMLPRLFAAQSLLEQPDLVTSVERMMRRSSPAIVAATLRGLACRPDRTDFLPAIEQPTLVIVGQHDAITPPQEARDMAKRLPNARFVEIREAAHLAPMEQPTAVNQVVLDFLRHLDQAESLA